MPADKAPVMLRENAWPCLYHLKRIIGWLPAWGLPYLNDDSLAKFQGHATILPHAHGIVDFNQKKVKAQELKDSFPAFETVV